MRPPSSCRLLATSFAAAALGLLASSAAALDFIIGDVEARLDTRLSYGIEWRAKDRNKDLITPLDGGRKLDPNSEDGNLNYDKGDVIAHAVMATGELTLEWENFGGFARGMAFYDFENHHGNLDRTDLRGDAKDDIGRDFKLLDAYVSMRFMLGSSPTQLRLGDQVINWGESVFFGATGIDIVNPLDVPAFQRPTSSARDLYRPVGMLWGASVITDHISVEFFYEYEWEPVRLPPVGSYFSTSDISGAGADFGIAGLASDLGTDIDQEFGLPAGTFGFDEYYKKVPRTDDNRPKDHGQFGITLQAILPEYNDTKLALHFVNYHSRFPMLNGRTANQQAVDATSTSALLAKSAEYTQLYLNQGLAPTAAADAAGNLAANLTISGLANQSAYFLEYPEDIKMIGFSANTTTLRTGSALSFEISHHLDVPISHEDQQIVAAILSPLGFSQEIFQNQIGTFAPNQIVKGYIERDKTQVVLGATQFFGPRFGAAQTILGMEIGWIHISEMPDKDRLQIEAGIPEEYADATSWGYRALMKLDYTSVLGAFNVSPLLIWSHDVDGNAPPHAGYFREGQKSVSLGVNIEYLSALSIDLTYVDFLGDDPNYLLNDRDYFGLQVSFSF